MSQADIKNEYMYAIQYLTGDDQAAKCLIIDIENPMADQQDRICTYVQSADLDTIRDDDSWNPCTIVVNEGNGEITEISLHDQAAALPSVFARNDNAQNYQNYTAPQYFGYQAGGGVIAAHIWGDSSICVKEVIK